MTSHPNCIFCKIAAGEAPATVYYHDEQVTAFRDTHPLAPIHILVIPNQHFDTITDITAQDEQLLGHLATVAARLAEQHGIDRSGFRLMLNTGPDAGQTVFHLHLHLVGGRRLPMRFE
jgi:histidine triad (HIT) family protein